MGMVELQKHYSEDGTRCATVWQSLGKWEFYVEYDDSGTVAIKCFLESEAEDAAEDYVMGIDDLDIDDGDSNFD